MIYILFACLTGGHIFTKLDLSQACLQLPVDEPYRVSVAPAIFQSVMDLILHNFPVAYYLDDILISAPTVEEHDVLVEKVLQRLQDAGIHLHQGKCHFGQRQVEYLGPLVDTTGIHPTKDKVRAIKEAPVPSDITQLRAFVGLVNYYGKFIPQVATHMTLLYKVTEKDHKWLWGAEYQDAFLKCKELLTYQAVLAHYDSAKPFKLACDAMLLRMVWEWCSPIPCKMGSTQ